MFLSLLCEQGSSDHHLQILSREARSSILLNEPQVQTDNPNFADTKTQNSSAYCCTVFQTGDELTDGRCFSSRNFILGVQSARSVKDVPIDCPSLSFRLGETLTKIQVEDQMQDRENMIQDGQQADKDSIAKHKFYLLQGSYTCKHCPVGPDQDLPVYGEASRLHHDILNRFLSCRESSTEKVLFCLFGGFCSMLCLGVVNLLCWLLLGKSKLATYHLGLPVLVLVVISVQACVSVVQRRLTQIESKFLPHGDSGNS